MHLQLEPDAFVVRWASDNSNYMKYRPYLRGYKDSILDYDCVKDYGSSQLS